jgi:ribosomal protein S11
MVDQWITYKITNNNSFISGLKRNGNMLIWHSAGKSGLKGPRRATPYASQVTGGKFFYRLLKKLKKLGKKSKKKSGFYPLFNIGIIIRSGRKRKMKLMLKSFFKRMYKNMYLSNLGKIPKMRVLKVVRKARIAHNGLRKKKKKRL